MASWREIDRIRKDAAAVRSIAERLLALPNADFTEWELMFLESMARRDSPDDLSTRQAEKLLEIRDGIEFISEHRGFSVRILIKGCYEARLDLSEEDERWIVDVRERNTVSIRRRHIGRLMRCARQLYLVEDEQDRADEEAA
jgi:hypothetical protein